MLESCDKLKPKPETIIPELKDAPQLIWHDSLEKDLQYVYQLMVDILNIIFFTKIVNVMINLT